VNIIDDHCPDRFGAMRLIQKIVSQGTGCDLRNLLVLSGRSAINAGCAINLFGRQQFGLYDGDSFVLANIKPDQGDANEARR
jgi:hypothetical protein